MLLILYNFVFFDTKENGLNKKTIVQNKAAINFSKEAFEEYGMPKDAFSLTGKINAASTKKGLLHNNQFHEHLKKLGENSFKPYINIIDNQFYN